MQVCTSCGRAGAPPSRRTGEPEPGPAGLPRPRSGRRLHCCRSGCRSAPAASTLGLTDSVSCAKLAQWVTASVVRAALKRTMRCARCRSSSSRQHGTGGWHRAGRAGCDHCEDWMANGMWRCHGVRTREAAPAGPAATTGRPRRFLASDGLRNPSARCGGGPCESGRIAVWTVGTGHWQPPV